MSHTVIKPVKLPGGYIIFSGADIIFRPEPKISLEDFKHHSFSVTPVGDCREEIDTKIMEIVKDFPFNNSRLTDLAIAVSEAVNNAIVYGPEDESRKIHIDIMYVPRVMLYIIVRDDLGEIDVDKINFDITDTFATDESGRGFLIMASQTNILAYMPGVDNIKEIILGLEPEKD